MAKEPRTQISGKEARYTLKQNNVNLSWLAEQLGITPQSVQSRLNAAVFSVPYQLEINNICGKRIFDVDMASTLVETKGRIPVIDMRVSAGFGVSLLDGNEQRISEYVTMCLVNIRTLVNRAIKLQLVRYDVHPFLYWHATQAEPRELDISVEDLRKFLTYQGKAKGKQRSVDFFLLSYYLGGINLIDLVAYDFRNYKQQPILRYIRRKTRIKKRSNQYVEFTIPAEAYPIIDKYMNPKTGHILDVTEKQYRTRLNSIDTDLRNIAQGLGITRKVTFYTARKSFVQHGFELGIPLETLEYCIGQSMKVNRPIFNYVKIMRQHADLAIRQILEQLHQKEDATAPST